MEGKITANANDIVDLQAKDTELEGKITDVEAGYIAADTALESKVTSAYKAADEKTLADAKAYADEKDVALESKVTSAYKAADEKTLADAKAYADEKDVALESKVTDAYTKADDAIKADVETNAKAIEAQGEAISGFNQRLGKLNGKVNKVGAGAAALAALHPLEYDPDDKLTFAAGVGNYAGENAAALGAFYRPDEKLMFSLGGTMGNGENMVNLGVSIGLDGAKGAPKLSRKELVEKVSTMEVENKNLKAENEALAERVARLERIVVSMVEKEEAK